MTITEAREAILDWMYDEYEYDDEKELGEDNTRIPVIFSQYEGQGDDLFVMEQWCLDLESKTLFCELNEERVPALDFECEDLEDLVDSLDFDGLIGEADEYIREHSEEFEEGE